MTENPSPTDMMKYAAPVGRGQELRLRMRARSRLERLIGHLREYDADTLLAVHQALDDFYATTVDMRAPQEDS